eukprot:TRINITY_DN10585_c0_g1_i1.p1 TRINITY_DN10585_c0_g1~~TRINITY_DN10585_c0_g1_i1.p1  ORF type:complete len:447 (+),score=120.39 TRINITY_DN10585_c0_g1_i1:122-1462(+)
MDPGLPPPGPLYDELPPAGAVMPPGLLYNDNGAGQPPAPDTFAGTPTVSVPEHPSAFSVLPAVPDTFGGTPTAPPPNPHDYEIVESEPQLLVRCRCGQFPLGQLHQWRKHVANFLARHAGADQQAAPEFLHNQQKKAEGGLEDGAVPWAFDTTPQPIAGPDAVLSRNQKRKLKKRQAQLEAQQQQQLPQAQQPLQLPQAQQLPQLPQNSQPHHPAQSRQNPQPKQPVQQRQPPQQQQQQPPRHETARPPPHQHAPPQPPAPATAPKLTKKQRATLRALEKAEREAEAEQYPPAKRSRQSAAAPSYLPLDEYAADEYYEQDGSYYDGDVYYEGAPANGSSYYDHSQSQYNPYSDLPSSSPQPSSMQSKLQEHLVLLHQHLQAKLNNQPPPNPRIPAQADATPATLLDRMLDDVGRLRATAYLFGGALTALDAELKSLREYIASGRSD